MHDVLIRSTRPLSYRDGATLRNLEQNFLYKFMVDCDVTSTEEKKTNYNQVWIMHLNLL